MTPPHPIAVGLQREDDADAVVVSGSGMLGFALPAASTGPVRSDVTAAAGVAAPSVGAWITALRVVVDIVLATLVLGLVARGSHAVAPVVLLAGGASIAPLLKLSGVYDRERLRLAGSILDELPSLLSVTGVFTLAVVIAAPGIAGLGVGGGRAAALWLTLGVALTGARAAVRSLAAYLSPRERCLVIGSSREAAMIQDRLSATEALTTVVGALPLAPVHLDELSDAGIAELIGRVVGDCDAQRVIITCPGGVMHPADGARAGVDLARIAASLGVCVNVAAGALDRSCPVADLDDLNGMTFVGVAPFGMSPGARAVKRAFDLLVGSAALVVAAPLMAVIAAAIRLDSDGPVFFRQARIGRDGVPFSMIKFRSMVIDAEERKAALRHLAAVDSSDLFKLGDDPRVTRVGRFVRRSSLDELPQLLNVLRGEMSLVGPRPLIVEEDATIHGLDRGRLHLTPGMTGPWQVLRRRVSLDEMLGIDYRYVAGWSLWLDVKLLLRTVLHVAHRRNL